MVVQRGGIHWVDLGTPQGSSPSKHRPVLVVQTDPYNRSQIATVIVAVITSNTQMAEHPGNVFLPSAASGLPKDSAVNVSQLLTVDKADLGDRVSDLSHYLMVEVTRGLQMILTG